MRSIDLSPLLRSTVGFDHLNRLMETALRGDNGESAYPPYNIEKVDEDAYRISMAVAGFGENDLDVTLHEGVLTVTGKAQEEDVEKAKNYLYRGIARRAFERRFRLADTIRVVGASYENGLLNIELRREVPEHMKPQKIAIGKTARAKVIEGKAA
ncbi:MAG: Hsp20 family protein [Sphingomonadales bacterium]|nr:Hsp20 family protein [Sphingomonadales bacterium]